MKLFLITYQVQFKQDSETVTIKDTMVVPAKTEASAKKLFLAMIEKVGTILMRYNETTRIMAPIRDMDGEVSILDCTKL